MAEARIFRTSIIGVGILSALFVGATIWLPLYVIRAAQRPGTFGFSIAFGCFVELLAFAYFLLPYFSGFRRSAVWGAYPAVGVALMLYIIVGVVIILTASRSPMLYTVLLVLATLLLLLVLGALVMLTAARKPEERTQQIEGGQAVSLAVSAQGLLQSFEGHMDLGEPVVFRDAEYRMRRLTERCNQCRPFGQPETAEIETEILGEIDGLKLILADIPAQACEVIKASLKEIESAAERIIQALDRRERLLVK